MAHSELFFRPKAQKQCCLAISIFITVMMSLSVCTRPTYRRAPGDAPRPVRLIQPLKFARDELQNVENVHRRISDRLMQLRTEGRAPARVLNYQKPKTPEFTDGPTLGPAFAKAGTLAFLAPFVIGTPFVIIAALRRHRNWLAGRS